MVLLENHMDQYDCWSVALTHIVSQRSNVFGVVAVQPAGNSLIRSWDGASLSPPVSIQAAHVVTDIASVLKAK